MDRAAEAILREEIFQHLKELVGDTVVVTRQQLWDFNLKGETYHLIDRNRGIRNPKDMLATLSILSDPKSKYPDEEVGGSLFAYAYREGSVDGDNKKLRRALELELPLILLRKIADGVFVPVLPVYVVADDKPNHRFLIALDESLRSVADPINLQPLEREYAQRVTKQRLHQPEFRGRVLRAYECRCAVCHLRHAKLLDAAHIIADGKPNGTPTVNNGLSLCKIHHAAYDENFLGITPGYEIRINQSLLDEVDGPMLRYGLQQMHGRPLSTPSRARDKPSAERLAERFAEFQAFS
ncbi:restriction endonuclease [Nocardia yunnanensis]|uniref:Restriction endonuclease n=1 Tax=Nocardia yunnanensis TaxID=2382165 RepID=A0A386ZMK4_9NOCA|nr:HNH endonuclease [Nocardia yunnanensis]AYF78553.1 restriction endonuclease [Nocardia yunnanensis]